MNEISGYRWIPVAKPVFMHKIITGEESIVIERNCFVTENREDLKQSQTLGSVFCRQPEAEANIKGSKAYPNIHGMVRFYQTKAGVLVAAEIMGLPIVTEKCKSPIFAFHIHNGGSCTGNESDAFANAMMHYNPADCSHPYHAGDLPPLFGNHGYAFLVTLTDRFSVKQIIGKTVIIHDAVDDFTTQPSGNSGAKIACGEIKNMLG